MKNLGSEHTIRRLRLVAVALIALASRSWATPIPICTFRGDQYNPAIWKNLVVWEDHRNDATNLGDIYAYDIETGQTLAICATAADQQMPAVWGDTIVWMDARNSPYRYDIYSFNIRTNCETAVALVNADKWSPSIYGNRVTWEQKAPGGTDEWDIYSATIGGTSEPITTDPGGQYCSQIWATKIVWKSVIGAASSWTMKIYDLLTRTQRTIGGVVSDGGGAIWGNYVVWEDERNLGTTKTDIYGYDLATGTEFPICTNSSHQWCPSIWGDNVVWMDKRNGNWDIYLYNIALGTEYPLVTGSGNQMFPRINENRVVYENDPDSVFSNGNSDIYMVELPAWLATKRTLTVGTNNLAVFDPIMTKAAPNFQFATWGRVKPIDALTFSVNDGSNKEVTVFCPGYANILSAGDMAAAAGYLDVAASPQVLICPWANLRRIGPPSSISR